MKITVAVLLLVATSYVADAKDEEKPTPSKTDKRDLLEGNYGDRTNLKNVLRSVQGDDDSNAEDELAGKSTNAFSPSSPHISKISDVLSSEGPHYSAISDHLFSPVSAYQSRLASPTLDQNSEHALAEPEYKPKPSKKLKKPKTPLKRTYPTYEPKPFQIGTRSNFANYDLSQFRNLYQDPNAFNRRFISPRIYSEQSHIHPVPQQVIAPQYYPQIYQQPQVYQQGYSILQSQRPYIQPVQYIQQPVQLPSVPYPQGGQQVIPNLVYTQGTQQAIPGVRYFHGAQQVISSVPYAQYSNQVVVPRIIYAQNTQQGTPGLAYAQEGQQILPSIAYAQGPQQAGVTYAHHQNQQVQANILPQFIRVYPKQPAPQQHINVQPQQTQGAVSYASFSQSLPPYSQPQSYPNSQEQQTSTIQHAQGLVRPGRPDVPEVVQPLQPVPDSQPQPQQISDSHTQATLQHNHEQTFITVVPDKQEQVQISTQNVQSESSNLEPTTQPPSHEADHSQSTQVPLVISTEPNIVQSQRQVLQDIRQQAVDKGLTYIQQLQSNQGYPQGLVFQQPGLINGGVTSTISPVQYYGNYAESLFRNYH